MLNGAVTIVTGATRGIGRAVTERFAEAGATVVGIYHKEVNLATELMSAAEGRGLDVRLHQGSITDPAFVQKLVDDTRARYGRIDVLVNNAGVAKDGFLAQMSTGDWSVPIDTNLGGTFTCLDVVLPVLIEQRKGSIVNVVSVTAVYGREGQCNYAASKGAIVGLTKLLSRRYARHGVRINAVAPGLIDTDMIALIPEKRVTNFVAHTHFGRLGTTREVADVVMYLSSDLASYVSGTVMKIDGGFLL